MTNLRAYIPHGLDPNITKLLRGRLGAKKGEALRWLWLCWRNAVRSEYGRKVLAVRKGVE